MLCNSKVNVKCVYGLTEEEHLIIFSKLEELMATTNED